MPKKFLSCTKQIADMLMQRRFVIDVELHVENFVKLQSEYNFNPKQWIDKNKQYIIVNCPEQHCKMRIKKYF